MSVLTTIPDPPAEVLQELLITLPGTIVTRHQNPPLAWPIYFGREPDSPDNTVTVYSTAGIKKARIQITGEVQQTHGVQIRVKSTAVLNGWQKTQAIAEVLDQQVRLTQVPLRGTTYTVWNVSRESVVSLGRQEGTGRYIHTLNVLMSLRAKT